jgi:hypothetical protein
MARKQAARKSIEKFIDVLSKNKSNSLKEITEAAHIGATFGTAFKELDLLGRKNGVLYYAGPYPIPIAKIANTYYEIRERHKTPKRRKVQSEPAPIAPDLRQDCAERTYTKAQVIEAFKAFYVREYDKMDDRAYTLTGFLLTALDEVL